MNKEKIIKTAPSCGGGARQEKFSGRTAAREPPDGPIPRRRISVKAPGTGKATIGPERGPLVPKARFVLICPADPAIMIVYPQEGENRESFIL